MFVVVHRRATSTVVCHIERCGNQVESGNSSYPAGERFRRVSVGHKNYGSTDPIMDRNTCAPVDADFKGTAAKFDTGATVHVYNPSRGTLPPRHPPRVSTEVNVHKAFRSKPALPAGFFIDPFVFSAYYFFIYGR